MFIDLFAIYCWCNWKNLKYFGHIDQNYRDTQSKKWTKIGSITMLANSRKTGYAEYVNSGCVATIGSKRRENGYDRASPRILPGESTLHYDLPFYFPLCAVRTSSARPESWLKCHKKNKKQIFIEQVRKILKTYYELREFFQ